ncbi:MAG: HAMP domain-containing sensor histidine kinase [Acidobacteriota bacterium]
MYRSFYWRIAISFVVLVVAVLVLQAAIFSMIMARSPDTAPPLYVVIDNGDILSSRAAPLDEATRAALEAVIRRQPVVAIRTAPIYVAGQQRGTIVLPPGPPSPVRQRLLRLAVPNIIVLALATAIAAMVIFRPARRRLQALELAAERLGKGDLAARAPVRGGDEIAHVAAAFNLMADELAAREESLRTADRVRRQILADVSHELKTPLTAMRGYVEALRMAGDTFEPGKRERYFATLERETLRLDRIVKDLLELGRLEDQAMRLEPRVFAIGRVFERVVARHEVETSARRITFTVDVGEEADQMVGDPHRIEQTIENLAANALRHTPDGGSITLASSLAPGTIRLSIIDSGEGIPTQHLAQIFDRFYKADRSRSGSPGSGLGLSITKAIVDRHGGHIAVHSRPGRTEFILTFPHDDDRPGFCSTAL